MIIDQQAAHERVLYEKFLYRGSHQTDSQQSLFPQTVEFSPPDFTMVLEIESELKDLGFHFELFGKNALVVTGVPAGAQSGSEKQLFEGLIQQFKQNQDVLSVSIGDNLARSLSKRMALRKGHPLQSGEMRSLVDSLFACKTPNYSPEGQPTFIILELAKIETYFNRH
jgi:DNA mismatch repair protein MutL